ncbi:hypothetical protein NADFUDRAFT_47055 [Nadsonia fulvescens var. elongata DSM 6958]|uniref:Uncharacterized protein n=1 Tax=Nadsonia fulvescens var. elongata DSM 6958 TaxID=857566 RepID=A0A1E3PJA1_9ASCO|nr:hypothetical protein NADFUDRAFT_47055 [Nadsonia fulvescens var. elongata DSM 6958]
MDARILNVSSKSEEDMTVEELAAEERRLNAISGSSNRATMQNIGKDKSFSTDLDYMEENSSNLAKYIKKGDIDLKNIAISQVKKMEKILDNCPLCMENGKSANTPIIAIGTKVYLTIPPQPELAKYSATIVPITHHNNTLMCEEDEWDEIRNFMSCLAKMYHSLGKGVIFYENAVSPHKNGHAVIEAVPIPLDLSNSAPAFFKDAILTSDEEWSQHLKIIDTGKRAREGAGRYAFKTSIAQEAPYFHVWFTLDGGYGHIVEDSNKWPRGDLFAREVIGGMMRLEPHIIKKQGRWRCNIDDPQVMEFEQKWENFDWTIEKNKQL